MLRIKKHKQLLHGRGNHGIWERTALKRNWISPDNSPNKCSINSKSHSSECGLQGETALLILNNLQKSIEILDQFGIDNTRVLV
jgi:hypothetical protein